MTDLMLSDIVIRSQGGEALFAPLSLTVPAGAVATIMGPSGIGKSTLIDFIGGHLDPSFHATGRVLLDGRDVSAEPAEARGIGILFQDAALFPHLSVGQNLAFGLAHRHQGRAARRRIVDLALARAGLAGFHDRDPATLSGGQRTRVALMRTLLAEPRALLLDEPFSRLDAALRDDVRRFVFAHVRERVIPVLMVTHDAGDAEAAGGTVLNL